MTIRTLYDLFEWKDRDKEKIVELQNQIAELKEQLEILPKHTNPDFSRREKEILRYIKRNPGTNKAQVVDALYVENIGSNVTIKKAINNLECYGLIRARKEKPNSQIYQLYINEDSIFLSLYTELENFKNVLFKLLDKIRTTFNKDNQSWFRNKNRDSTLLYDILLIYHHVLGAYLTYSMLKWSVEIKDKATLTRIYAILMYRLVEIQLRLSEVFLLERRLSTNFARVTVREAYSPVLQEFVRRMFLLEPHTMINILGDYKRHNLHNDVLPVLASAWEIGSPIYPYIDFDLGISASRDIKKLRDWRYVIASYLVKNKNIQVDEGIWKIIGRPPRSG
jgi:hypothetical protein